MYSSLFSLNYHRSLAHLLSHWLLISVLYQRHQYCASQMVFSRGECQSQLLHVTIVVLEFHEIAVELGVERLQIVHLVARAAAAGLL